MPLHKEEEAAAVTGGKMLLGRNFQRKARRLKPFVRQRKFQLSHIVDVSKEKADSQLLLSQSSTTFHSQCFCLLYRNNNNLKGKKGK